MSVDFNFSDEQKAAAEVLRDLLAHECGSAQLRAVQVDGGAAGAARWSRLAQLGVCGVLAPEAAGGLGLAAMDFVLLAEACGWAGLPEPLVDHAGVAVPLLADLATSPAAMGVLARAAAGQARIAVVHPDTPAVVDGDLTEALLIVRDGAAHLVPTAEVSLTRRRGLDPLRRLFSVACTPSHATRLANAGEVERPLRLAFERGALFAAAQCLGLAERQLHDAVAYATERRQFGRPIGSYQAVKHHLASVRVKIEFARPVVYAAAALIDEDDAFSRARVSHAKLAAGEVADLASRAALQVHGALGYSWEVDVHLFLKRALALAGAWGDIGFHRRRVAARIQDMPLGPQFTFAREAQSHAA